MSQQQTPVASQLQPKAPVIPVVTSKPLPLDGNLLRLISGGTETSSMPVNNW